MEPSKDLLKCHNVCECLLVDDLVYGTKLDSLVLTRREERFHALLKVEEATFKPRGANGYDKTPDFHVVYTLLRLDFEKTKQYMDGVIGMCNCTMANYNEIEKDNIVTKIDQEEWRNYDDQTKLDYLQELEQAGTQIFGYCDACRTAWEADERGLVPFLFERFVNEKLYIHPFILSRHDRLDDIEVNEDIQIEYALYRLNEAFGHCVVGDTFSLVKGIEDCYDYDHSSKLSEVGKKLSSYGKLDRAKLGKVTSRFKSFTLFDSADPIHAKRASMDFDVTNVESTKVNGWFGGKNAQGFEVRYTKLRESKWTRTIALRSNSEEYKHLFALGFTTAEKANRWKMKITSEIPEKLEPKIEFEREFQEFSNAMDTLAKEASENQDGLDKEWKEVLYPETGDEFIDELPQWKVIKNVGYLDSETELLCLSEEDFPCSVLEAREVIMGQRNFYLVVEQLENSSDEDFVVDMEKYQGSAMVPTFEREVFSPTLIALDVNFCPPGGDVKYGIVKQSSLVTGRVRNDYELGMPMFPYNMGWGLNLLGEETAVRIAHEGYRRKEWLKDKVNQARGKETTDDHAAHQYTFYDRWFALDKKFWTKDVEVEDKKKEKEIRQSVRVMWKNTEVDEANRRIEGRKTHSKLAKTAELSGMFLRVTDTTVWDKDHQVPEAKLAKLRGLQAIKSSSVSGDAKSIEARCLAVSNIGHNTQYWEVRNNATRMLIDEFELVFRMHTEEEEQLHLTAIIFAALDKMFTGLRSLVIGVEGMRWVRWLFAYIEEQISKWAKDDQHPMKRLFRVWARSWKNPVVAISSIKAPAACNKMEAAEYQREINAIVKLNGKLSELATQNEETEIEDAEFIHPRTYIPADELDRSLLLVDVESGKARMNELIVNGGKINPEHELSTAVLQIGFILAQRPDRTAQVAFGFFVNNDAWTQMPYLKLTEDKTTVQMIKRSLRVLRTPLAGNVFARWTEQE